MFMILFVILFYYSNTQADSVRMEWLKERISALRLKLRYLAATLTRVRVALDVRIV